MDFKQLRFETDDDGATVYAVIVSAEEGLKYSETWLQEQLVQQGYSGLSVAQPTQKKIAELIETNQPGRVMVGQKVDAKIEAVVSSDTLSASLRITAAKGGQVANTEAVIDALKDKEIDFQLVNKKRIVGLIRKSRIVEPGEMVEVVVAKGKKPEHGLDTQFECLLGDITDRKPNQRDDGSLDYYDLGEILSIEEGSQLMRKYPPTKSKNGRSVTGQELPARIGKALNFKKCKGAMISSSDPDLLISAIKGQPIIVDKGVNVDNLHVVKNVNVHTGHIDYDGSLVVKGDVASGTKIKVSGDVQIFGTVENACIDADGNVDIKLGAIGRAETLLTEGGMQINCKGNLSVGFLESVEVNVNGDVLVKSRLSNCEVKAGHQVIVGNRQQDKSGIVGGHVLAGSIIRAEVLGSSGCAATHVEISCAAGLLEQYEKLKKEIVANNELLVSMLGLMVGLSKKRTEEAKKTLEETKKETEEIKALTNDLIVQKDNMEAFLEKTRLGKIIAQKEAFPGVTIKIIDQEQVIKSRYAEGTFLLFEGAMSHTASVK